MCGKMVPVTRVCCVCNVVIGTKIGFAKDGKPFESHTYCGSCFEEARKELIEHKKQREAKNANSF